MQGRHLRPGGGPGQGGHRPARGDPGGHPGHGLRRPAPRPAGGLLPGRGRPRRGGRRAWRSSTAPPARSAAARWATTPGWPTSSAGPGCASCSSPAGAAAGPGRGAGPRGGRPARPARRRRLRAGRREAAAPPRRAVARRLRGGRPAARPRGGGGGARLPGRRRSGPRRSTSTGSRAWPPRACCSSTRRPAPTSRWSASLHGGQAQGLAARPPGPDGRPPPAARLLADWLRYPLTELAAIGARLDAVEELSGSSVAREDLARALRPVADVERLVSRLTLRQGNGRDLRALGGALLALPALAELLDGPGRPAPARRPAPRRRGLEALAADLDATVAEEPPATLADGGPIRRGHSAELDELVAISEDGKGTIAALEAREKERTGIGSLKVRYNKVFGYFIEVTKANLHAVPADYERRQTTVGGERFVTPELKGFEEKVLTAEERRLALEQQLFEAAPPAGGGPGRPHPERRGGGGGGRRAPLPRPRWPPSAATAGRRWTTRRRWSSPRRATRWWRRCCPPTRAASCPTTSGWPRWAIRRPRPTARFLVITGPNMAGKSTVMRQAALASLMAQVGSFVPARRARIGVADRIFTRVGASDDLARGRSTFMVEMTETAAILHNATRRSLVVLDEIGRGTSTFDGVSIAWAVAEHLHDRVGCRTLFATHYHELQELVRERPGVKQPLGGGARGGRPGGLPAQAGGRRRLAQLRHRGGQAGRPAGRGAGAGPRDPEEPRGHGARRGRPRPAGPRAPGSGPPRRRAEGAARPLRAGRPNPEAVALQGGAAGARRGRAAPARRAQPAGRLEEAAPAGRAPDKRRGAGRPAPRSSAEVRARCGSTSPSCGSQRTWSGPSSRSRGTSCRGAWAVSLAQPAILPRLGLAVAALAVALERVLVRLVREGHLAVLGLEGDGGGAGVGREGGPDEDEGSGDGDEDLVHVETPGKPGADQPARSIGTRHSTQYSSVGARDAQVATCDPVSRELRSGPSRTSSVP